MKDVIKSYEEFIRENKYSLNESDDVLNSQTYDETYYDEKSKTVEIPENYKIIEKYVFAKKRIDELDLSQNTNLEEIRYGAFSQCGIKNLKLPSSIMIIGEHSFEFNKIQKIDLSNCTKLKKILADAFLANLITDIKLPINIKSLTFYVFAKNQIKLLDLSSYKYLYEMDFNVFLDNPLEEIKILKNLKIPYDKMYEKDPWNKFVKYYNENDKKSGDYKYENDEWAWYPL